jgi:hypothetical protein
MPLRNARTPSSTATRLTDDSLAMPCTIPNQVSPSCA